MLNKVSSFEEAHKISPKHLPPNEQGTVKWSQELNEQTLSWDNAWTCTIPAFVNEKNHTSYMLSKSLRIANQTDSSVATGIKPSEACVIRP